MKKFLRVMAPVVVLFAAIGVVIALMATAPKPEEAKEDIRPTSLFVAEVEDRPVTLKVRTQGEVRPKTEIDLVAQVGGRVMGISDSFVDGGIVKAGETLVELESRDYELDVTRAEARVADARLKLAQTKADAEIVQKQFREWLKEEPDELASRQPHIAQAVAALKAAEADLADARLDLERANLSVPFDGRIRTRNVAIGQVVTPGQVVARVFATDTAEVRLPLTDEQLAQLNLPLAFEDSNGTGPMVTFNAVVAGKERRWTGRIVRTDAAVDRTTRLIYAIAEVQNPYETDDADEIPMAVGLFVNAEISGRQLARASVLPRTALRNQGEVYVVGKDNILSIRKVQVLDSTKEQVILADQFAEDERVVTSPLQNAVEGMAVNPLSRQSAQQLANAPQKTDASR